MRARYLTAILFATLFAPPAQAISIGLVQTGGTAVGGVGGAGDTLIIDVVAILGAGEGTIGVFPTLQWDLEGGDVLDLVAASEPAYQYLNGHLLTGFSLNSRIGSPLDEMATSIFFESDDPVYPSIAGPEAFFGLEQVSGLVSVPIPGPGTFTVGTLEFVLNSGDSTQISFYLGSPFGTVIIDDCSAIIGSTPQCKDLASVSDLGTFQVNPSGLIPNPEPGTGALLSLGLVAMVAHRRAVRSRRTA
jgi:hypothetical protein